MLTTTPTRQYALAFYLQSVPFTRDVIEGRTSLGGSESAALGLINALAARGHDVHVFATQLEAPGTYRDVQWHPAETELAEVIKFHRHDVFVSLRMPHIFALPIPAKLRVLWNQDLLTDPGAIGLLATVDRLVFVSAYHREQWLTGHEWLRPLAHVTRNGIDPADLETADVDHRVKRRAHFIHTSRPERGLDAVLTLWPQIRARVPDATLAVCRYSSMYDAAGWGKVCESYDRKLQALHARVGGIEWLGELTKPQLYGHLAEARALFYPTSQPSFAETNCVAALEAQACRTPVLGAWRGALTETVHPDAGVLVEGDWRQPDVQRAFVEAAVRLCEDGPAYEAMRAAGRAYALPRSSHATLAAEWEAWIDATFETRYQTHKPAILRQLLHWDNHVAAQGLAEELASGAGVDHATQQEGAAALALCQRVIAQDEQTPEDYARFATQDVAAEADQNERFHWLLDQLRQTYAPDASFRLLDVACGNGSAALAVLRAFPGATVEAWDYSAGVLALASQAAQQAGVATRVQFHQGAWTDVRGVFNVVWCGEFLEHVAEPWLLLDRLEQHAAPHGRIYLTTPCGPFAELLGPGTPRKRGHLHSFSLQDVSRLLAPKVEAGWEFLPIGTTPRGSAVGYWLLTFRPGGGPALHLDYAHTVLTERPYERLTAMLIVKDEAAHLRRCLDAVWPVVDEVVLADFGSTDGTPDIARRYPHVTLLDAPWPDSFADARNLVLAETERRGAEWGLWIDADEVIEQPLHLRRLLESRSYHGFVVEQRHLTVDGEPGWKDKPVRCFRLRRGVQFFGRVHEQPEDAPDAGINPALHQTDTYLLHYGYVTDRIRRRKLLDRNLALLAAQIDSPAPRELDWLLWMRDLVNLAGFAREEAGGTVTRQVLGHLARALRVYDERGFGTPTHRLHELAWPIYQQALAHLDASTVQVAWAFAAQVGTLPGVPRPERFRARTALEAQQVCAAKTAAWTAKLAPRVIDVTPVVTTGWTTGRITPRPVEEAVA